MAYAEPELFDRLIALLEAATIQYLSAQVTAGAECLQIFDSWAGLLDDYLFARYVVEPTARIVAALKAAHPGIRVIGFPRLAGLHYPAYAARTKVDALGLDTTVPVNFARVASLPTQGNLDPALLLEGGEPLRRGVRAIVDGLQGKPHIFNLGHGVSQHTNPDHVAQLVAAVRRGMKTAIVLFNLGGPDTMDAVRPFLINLFKDRRIIGLPNPMRWALAQLIGRRRTKTARGIYELLGGGSPLLANTEAQARALQAELGDGTKAFIAMRYWHPMARDTARAVAAWGPDRVVLLPLYPQYSTTTTASSVAQWHGEIARAGCKAPTTLLCCYPAEPGFIAAKARLTAAAIDKAAESGVPRVLFSAHGLPEKIIAAGDPYQWQCEKTAKAIAAAMDRPGVEWLNTYQSRVGPLKWIGPATDDEIRRAGAEKRPLVIVPIAIRLGAFRNACRTGHRIRPCRQGSRRARLHPRADRQHRPRVRRRTGAAGAAGRIPSGEMHLAGGRPPVPRILRRLRLCGVCEMTLLWLKAFHVIAVIAWMAGMLYLPRLFVYHTRNHARLARIGTLQGDGAPPASRHHEPGDDRSVGTGHRHGGARPRLHAAALAARQAGPGRGDDRRAHDAGQGAAQLRQRRQPQVAALLPRPQRGADPAADRHRHSGRGKAFLGNTPRVPNVSSASLSTYGSTSC